MALDGQTFGSCLENGDGWLDLNLLLTHHHCRCEMVVSALDAYCTADRQTSNEWEGWANRYFHVKSIFCSLIVAFSTSRFMSSSPLVSLHALV